MKEEKIFGWSFSLAKSLIMSVLQNDKKPLTFVFKKFALENSRATHSVRNYYYKLIETLQADKKLLSRFNLSNDEVKKLFNSHHFSSVTEKELLLKILPLKNQKSVRSACLQLAKNDTNLMVRYQNKYRNLIRNKKAEVIKVMEELTKKGIKTRNPYGNNIVVMQREHKLTEGQLKSVFMGLVRLIKEHATEEAEQNIKTEMQFANNTLQATLIDLRRKQLLIDELKKENDSLKKSFLVAKENLAKSQAQNLSNMLEIQNLVSSKKMQDLKNFIEGLVRLEEKRN